MAGTIPQQPPTRRTAIVVAGMHRSGTSAFTRCLNLLGAQLPGNLIPAQSDNPTGFWESTDVQQLNDAVLEGLQSHWDDVRTLRWDRVTREQKDIWVERICTLLERHCDSGTTFVLKDPRLCRLLPLWQKAFSQLHMDARYVLPFRDPREVAASLSERNALPDRLGQRLWLRHVIDAERDTRGLPRVFSPFAGLLDQPMETLRAVWRGLELGDTVDWELVEPAVGAYLQPQLRHQRASELPTAKEALPIVDVAFQALQRLSGTARDSDAERLLDEAAVLAVQPPSADTTAGRTGALPVQAPWRVQSPDHGVDDGSMCIDDSQVWAARQRLETGRFGAFSIVMPTWNRAARIGDAIDSVLAQSYAEWELIVCDDGSEDGTLDYLRQHYAYWIDGGKIRCISSEHRGASAARNTALQHARHPWIAYLDSDNYWHKDYLLVVADTLAQQPHKRCAYACLRVHEEGIAPSHIRGRTFDWERLRRGNYIDINVFAHHRDVWLQLGGFDETLRRLEDWDLILRFTRLYPPAYIPYIGCDYYLSPALGNLSLQEAVDIPYALVRARFSTEPLQHPAARGLEVADGTASSDRQSTDSRALIGWRISDEQLKQIAGTRPVLRCADQADIARTVTAYTNALAEALQSSEEDDRQSRGWAQRALKRQRARGRRALQQARKQGRRLRTAEEALHRAERARAASEEIAQQAASHLQRLEQQAEWTRGAHHKTLKRFASQLTMTTNPNPGRPRSVPARADGLAGFHGLPIAARQRLGAPLRPRHYRQMLAQCRTLLANGLFDVTWYQWRYPDLASWPYHPLWHWLLKGCSEGRQPNAFFDPHWYRNLYPDVAQAKCNPLLHYLRHGASEERHTSPLFDRHWYHAQYPDVLTANIDPLQHYLRHGVHEGRRPHPLIDPGWYLRQYPEVSDLAMDAVTHFLLIGGDEGRSPGPDFDSAWYLLQYPDVRAAGINPLVHFLYHGAANGRRAGPDTGTTVIKASNPQAAENALAHRPQPTELRATPGHAAHVAGRPTILLCAHAAGTHLFGGERSFLELLRLLEGMPYNVVVTLPQTTATYREVVRARCCEVIELPYQFWSHDTDPDPNVVAQLQTILVTRRIDVVHVNTIMIREPLLAASRLGLPRFVHVRESVRKDRWLQERIGLPADDIIALVQGLATAIVANSEESAREFGSSGECHLVPNTFDLSALNLPVAGNGDTIQVGLVSSNLPKKGIEDFAQIAQACAERFPQARFLLIGPENAHVQALRRRQADGELSDNVVFAGYAEQPEAAIAQLDIVLNLSHFAESFGRTVAEGLAARRPAIVYDLGAPKYLVQHEESGFIVPHGDWQQVVEHLSGLLQSPQQIAVMGEKGRAFISTHFDAEAGRRALERAYRAHLPETPASGNVRPLAAHADPRYRMATPPVHGKRLAYFCWHFPVPSETFVLNELRALVRDGHDVHVFCRHSPYPEFQPDFAVEWQCVESPEALAKALRICEREHVHAHFTYPTVTDMVWPACEQAGIPFTFIAHAQDIFRYENDQKNRVGEVASSPLCKAVLTLGQFHRDYLRARGVPASKIIINPNAVDFERFPFSLPSTQPARADKSVCAIHRLTEKKGLHHLLSAARLLAEEGVRFHIYGYGEQEEALTARIAEEGLTNVHFHGPLHGAQAIVDTLRRHDLFAAPSVRIANGDMDGIPTSVIEAMATGTPVITTDVASIPDLVQDSVTGIIVPTDDATALAEGIRRFFRLSAEQIDGMARSARQRATARHDVNKLIHVLRRVWEHQVTDIVIVSWNNLPELREVVGRLFDFTRTPFHLTIADNGSNSEIIAYLNHLQVQHDNVTVVFNDANHYVGPGTNIAAQQGRGDTIVYVCGKEGFALQEGWETELTYYMEQHPEVGLAGTPGYSPSYLFGRDLAQGIPTFSDFRNQAFAQTHPHRAFFHIQGGLFAVRRGMLNDIGGFSEAVPHAHTDVEYSYFVESCGWQLGVPPHMLALFSKTQPDYWTRIDDTVRICHPPRLEDLPQLDRLAARAEQRCPQCGWQGSRFSERSTLAPCPQCGATEQARFQLRVLAASPLTHRPIALTVLGMVNAMPEFWDRHFARATTHQIATIRALRDLPSASQDAICLDLSNVGAISTDELLSGCAYAMKEQGGLALIFGIGNRLLEQIQDSETQKRYSLKLESTTIAGSWAAGHSAYPVILLQREGDLSELRWPLLGVSSALEAPTAIECPSGVAEAQD